MLACPRFNHVDDSRGVGFLPPFVCLSVCFSARYLKKTITKLDTEIFHDDSGVKRWKFKVRESQKHIAGVGLRVFTLLWALASVSLVY